jgi:hypothetical protein
VARGLDCCAKIDVLPTPGNVCWECLHCSHRVTFSLPGTWAGVEGALSVTTVKMNPCELYVFVCLGKLKIK